MFSEKTQNTEHHGTLKDYIKYIRFYELPGPQSVHVIQRKSDAASSMTTVHKNCLLNLPYNFISFVTFYLFINNASC